MKTGHRFLIECAIAAAIGVALAIISGCVRIDYRDFHYTSFGGRGFDKLEGVRDGNEIIIRIDGYKSENAADIARETARGTAEGLMTGIKPVP